VKSALLPGDLYRLTIPNDPRCARDGRVFFVLGTQDEEADETSSAIYAVRDGRPPTRFTSGKKDRMPRVAPDVSRLAFVAERGDGKRIYVTPLDGGEAQPVSESYDAITALEWSPDSRRLAFTATAPYDAENARIAHDEKSGARHIRTLPFKSDDDGLLDGRRKHLFVLTLEDGGPQQITQGDFDVNAPAWSPDGTRLAFSAQIDAPETAFYSDLYVVTPADRSRLKLTRSRGPAGNPAFSHRGDEIAYIGHEQGDDAGGRFNTELLVLPAGGGEPRSLSQNVDRSVSNFVICDTRGTGGEQAPFWSADDAELFVPLSSEGTCAIAAFRADGSAHRTVAGGERDIYAFSRDDDGTLAFVYATPTVPSEIAWCDAAGNERRLTDANPWLAERAVRAPRRVRPPASDGTPLDLWLLEPDAPLVGAPPLVLQVHGGPHAAYGYAFMFEFQMLASLGIAVAYGNPRGSQTYGHAYADASTGDWGGIDVGDLLSLLDGALASGRFDHARIGIAGGSYGGFMATWLLGHSDRFAAGISMRAVNDLVSEVGATDLGWFIEREVAAPWEDGGAKLFANSPMRSAHRITAPLLILHSERDYRCAIDQGEQLFTLLRRLGRTQTEFVRFTGDGHNLSRTGKPRNRVLRLRAIAHWLIRHLRPDGIAPVPESAGALFAPLSSEAE